MQKMISLNKCVSGTVYPISSLFQSGRSYATKDRTSEKRYKDGKLIVEEIEDPTLFPKYLLTLKGSDECVLEGYFNFVRKAAKMTDVNLTKRFGMPASSQTFKAKRDDTKSIKKEDHYILKEYLRIIEISELTSDKSDIFMDFIIKSLPAGVDINIDLKRWEMVVDPDHPSLRGER